MKNIFDFSHFRGDLFGGLTAGIVALPLALAFGEQSGLGASAGLYGAAFIALLAALFGGTNTQISGPTAPMTVLSATIVSSVLLHNEGSLQNALPIILGVFALSGLFQIALGAMKIGSYIRYVPRTVVSGFMTGIGVIILITQILPAVGYIPSEDEVQIANHLDAAEHILVEDAFHSAHESWLEHTPGDLTGHQLDIHHHLNFTDEDVVLEAQGIIQSESKGVIGAIRFIPGALMSINWIELILALSTIIIIYGFKRITTVVPSTLVALIAVTLVAYFGDFIYRPITAIATGFPAFQTGIFSISNLVNMGPYVGAALVLSLLGTIDSLLTSVVADNLTRTRHKPNQELIGQGIGNAVAGFFGGLPGAGATIRTVVNIQAGGRTRLSGVVAGAILFLIIVTLAPLASIIPQSVLAGILFTVGIGVMDYKGLRELRHMPWSDRIVLITVLVLTVTWQLVYAVALGLIIASFQFMRYMGEHTTRRFSVDMNQDIEGGVSAATKVLYGPLFFGNASALADLRETIPQSVKQLNIDMRRVHFVDQSGLSAIEDTLIDLTGQGVEVTFVGLLDQPRLRLESSIALQSIGVIIEEAKGGEFID
ncbi:MAG: SulP family inorganic anion transporter [Flavobacteriales bacterium]|nr:SulP family inorganic anion transporter [Flavobacteriales bacterium]